MVVDKDLEAKVIMAMRRTIDAIGFDLQEMYEDGIIPKTDAREMVIDADRIFMYGGMNADTEAYYRSLSKTHRDKLVKKAIPYDLC